MKSHTDLEQSKKLAEFLPLESADMYWLNRHIDLTETEYEVFVIDKSNKYIDFFKSYAVAVAIDKNEVIPCWSLSALLAQMPWLNLDTSEDNHYRVFWHEMYSEWHTNAVDACVELITRKEEEQ